MAFVTGDWLALHRALGLRPWNASPLDALTAEPPEWMTDLRSIGDWKAARELRRALLATRSSSKP